MTGGKMGRGWEGRGEAGGEGAMQAMTKEVKWGGGETGGEGNGRARVGGVWIWAGEVALRGRGGQVPGYYQREREAAEGEGEGRC